MQTTDSYGTGGICGFDLLHNMQSFCNNALLYSYYLYVKLANIFCDDNTIIVHCNKNAEKRIMM